MLALLFIIIFAAAVISAVFFQCSLIMCVIAAASAALLFAVEVFLFKGAAFKRVVMPIGAAALICLCLMIPNRPTHYGYYDHAKMFAAYADAVNSGKAEKAETRKNEMVEKYGEDDGVRFVMAADAISKGNIGTAEQIVNSFSDKKSQEYYILQEEIITAKYVTADDLRDNLCPLYIEAADTFPEWTYVSKNAGGMLFDSGEYNKSAYYLTRALISSEEDDPMIYYYLGASLCEQGYYDKGLTMLDKALELGVDDEFKGYISWYAHQSGMEGAGDNEGNS